ncbi:MAG: biotin--[Fretibacterium sp.]|nr:biotin--[acetyl-CoA-carboxylase] ligase [Fretibacterium sp.]
MPAKKTAAWRGIREELLRVFEERRGEYLSGEAIGQRLGVSRAAVWKAVEALRREGYRFSAATRRGYALDNTSDILTEEGIRAHLSQDSPVSRVICLETVDSTNNYAKRLALTRVENGTLVAANQQTAGKGRRGHSFMSPPGTGLYMSLVLRPTAAMERFQMITVAAAVAVCLTLEELTQEKPLIKWVNDIYLRRRETGEELKICGILSEAVSDVETGSIESVVVGLGLNVTTRNFGELKGIAGSLFPKGVGRNQIAAGIAEHLMDLAGRLDDPKLIQEYRDRSLLLGREITYAQDEPAGSPQKETAHRALAVDIDAQGGLVVENKKGERVTLRSGEVFEVQSVR